MDFPCPVRCYLQFWLQFSLLLKNKLITVYFHLIGRSKPYGNHGLCPIFYNLAFKHKFMAVEKSRACNKALTTRDLTMLPSDGIRMGYFQPLYNSTEFNGINLYAITKKSPPYC